MKENRFRYMMITFLAVILSLSFIACGSSGGGGGGGDVSAVGDSQPVAQQTIVSGVAATGDPVEGNAYLMDANGTLVGPVAIAPDGSYSFDVTALTPPYFLYAEDNAGNRLYSVAMGPGIANINPLTHIAVAVAAGVNDPGSIDPANNPISESDIAQALNTIREILLAFFESYPDVNPLSDPFAANHTGLDAFFDQVIVDLDELTGSVAFTDPGGTTLAQASVGGISTGSTTLHVSGSGSNEPKAGRIAILNLDVDEASLATSSLSIQYQFNIALTSDVITDISMSGGTITIIGTGTMDGIPGYEFTVQIINGSPDQMGIEVKDLGGNPMESFPIQPLTDDGPGFQVCMCA